MKSTLMIAVLALTTATFTFAAKKPKTTEPAAGAPATTEQTTPVKKAKGKKHHKEQTEQKPKSN